MSQTPQHHQKLPTIVSQNKMCKSPKNNAAATIYKSAVVADKIDYENMNTNCTVVGSNNLNLVKKPQMITNMSPVYSSNPSPGYPQSPYSSPASLKSPSPSLKPPTPQPPTFPVMQIIHNSHPLLARPIQTQPAPPQNLIKLKPHLNILPKPSASPQPSPKPSVSPHQIVIPANQPAIVPTQPVLLNQMPLLTAAPGVQFILRPQQTTKLPTATPTHPAQGLILQQSPQPLLQIQQQPSRQPLVRVLTNGVQLATPTPTYVTTTAAAPPPPPPSSPSKKKPQKKPKKKLDLANIMKLSGIGDEDDIQFESDASLGDGESDKKVPVTPTPTLQPQHQQQLPQLQPVVQLLNHQNFNTAHPTYNPFIATPNFTINNGLMVQRSGGFKLTVGEDGRLVLQHDPTLNQDLQSQLILQSIFGLNGGLVLQPSIADPHQHHHHHQQTVHQQTVVQQQTIQQQTIQTVQQQQQPTVQQTVQQTIQHQTVQSQPLLQQPVQLVQPHLQTIQTQIQGQLQSLLQHQQTQTQHNFQQHHHQPQQQQPVLKVQPFHKSAVQPPVQAVHPLVQPVQHQEQQQQQPQQQQPASYVVNLTPEQLEQLKRNGQLTVNGQTIFMQRPKQQQEECKKLSPKQQKTVRKVKTAHKGDDLGGISPASPPKISPPPLPPPPPPAAPPTATKHAVVQPTTREKSPIPAAAVNPPAPTPPPPPPPPQPPATPLPAHSQPQTDANGANQEVERLLGQLLEESGNINIVTAVPPTMPNKNQRIHTIQLTPQKQEHLKNVQMQIQTLSANLTPGNNTEIQAALKMLFAEQQKILATGKLLPPDKVYYHNNHLTIVNPSSLKSAATAVPMATTNADSVAGQHLNNVPAVAMTATTTSSQHQQAFSSTQTINQLPRLPEQQPTSQIGPQQSIEQPQLMHQHHPVHSITKKAHLIEAQLNQDQAGAVKPDIHSPFRDKKDACIRLIRYHCMDQPLLSQKDLDKADEIFEMTAKHFIGKYAKMVDKYKYLLMKESMRQVQTSELMMLDRMYLSEERQSLMRLRQEAEEVAMVTAATVAPPQPIQPTIPVQQQSMMMNRLLDSGSPVANNIMEDYDEWACIQRELGCIPQQEHHHHQSVKRSAVCDSRLETLKRFRVEKHSNRRVGGGSASGAAPSMVDGGASFTYDERTLLLGSNSGGMSDANIYNDMEEQSEHDLLENNSIDEQVQSAIDSILNLQQNTALDLDSILS